MGAVHPLTHQGAAQDTLDGGSLGGTASYPFYALSAVFRAVSLRATTRSSAAESAPSQMSRMSADGSAGRLWM